MFEFSTFSTKMTASKVRNYGRRYLLRLYLKRKGKAKPFKALKHLKSFKPPKLLYLLEKFLRKITCFLKIFTQSLFNMQMSLGNMHIIKAFKPCKVCDQKILCQVCELFNKIGELLLNFICIL